MLERWVLYYYLGVVLLLGCCITTWVLYYYLGVVLLLGCCITR
jgi:hypothetical protein